MRSEVSILTELEDNALVGIARDSECRAFAELVRRYQPSVYLVCYRLLDNPQDAEDATQEVFLKAYDKLTFFQSRCSFKTWITRVAVNVSLNARKRRRSFDSLSDGFHSNEPDPEAAAIRRERNIELWKALQLLPSSHRAAVVLRDLEGMDYRQVATVLGVPDGTAKGWVHRGRVRLKELLVYSTR